ncbi:hypothetical protein AB3S75_015713 [Citrus x aurantiifolia]
MAHAIVSSLLDQLKSIAQDQVKEKWRLVTGVEQQVGKLTTNLQAVQAVLEDAEQRQMKQDKAVTFWLDQLRDASYDMEDVLEEWITETRKLQLDEGGDDDDDDNDNAFVSLLTKELRIEDCPILEERYRAGKGQDWHKISHIPHIKWSP